MRDKPLSKAIKLAGGIAKLASLLSMKRQAVFQWKRCPPGRAKAIESALNGAITAHDLRPDIFGDAA